MFNSSILLVLVILAIAAVLFAADRKFVRSMSEVVDTVRTTSWVESVLGPIRSATLSTQEIVRKAYRSDDGSSDFSLHSLTIITAVAIICAFAIWTEFNFASYSFSYYLGETADSPTLFYLPFSNLIAATLAGIVVVAGLVLFDGLGSATEPSDVPQNRINENRRKLAGVAVLLVISTIQGFAGAERGEELIATASYEAQIRGGESVAAPESGTGVMKVANTVVGVVLPLLSAFCTRYLLTLIQWLVSGCIAIGLFFGLWLPTWMINAVAVRHQQKYGLPNEIRQSGSASEGPGDSEMNAEGRAAYEDRVAEEREEVNERREAEERERFQTRTNPFAG